MTNNQKKFHITVGASPNDGVFSVQKEIELVKTAIIYADSVKLCSIKTAMMMGLVDLTKMDTVRKMEYTKFMALSLLDLDEQEIFVEGLDFFKSLYNKKHLTPEEVIQKYKMEMFSKKISRMAMGEAAKTGFDKLIPAMNKGLLELEFYNFHPTKSDAYEMTYEWIHSIENALKKNTYPLFDVETGSLLLSGIQSGVFQINNSTLEKARHVSIMANIMEKLPCFEYATIDEAIDIRKELTKPLEKFRASMINYSEIIKNQPWDSDFTYDCEKLFIKDIVPTVNEIEEYCNQNSYIKCLLRKTIDSLPTAGGIAGFGMIVSQFMNLADILLGAGATGGAVIALKAAKDWYEKAQAIKTNEMFFYYKAGKILKDNHKKPEITWS